MTALAAVVLARDVELSVRDGLRNQRCGTAGGRIRPRPQEVAPGAEIIPKDGSVYEMLPNI